MRRYKNTYFDNSIIHHFIKKNKKIWTLLQDFLAFFIFYDVVGFLWRARKELVIGFKKLFSNHFLIMLEKRSHFFCSLFEIRFSLLFWSCLIFYNVSEKGCTYKGTCPAPLKVVPSGFPSDIKCFTEHIHTRELLELKMLIYFFKK